MREQILIRSVQQLLAPGARVGDLALMWRRSAGGLLVAVGAGIGLFVLLALTGVGSPTTRVVAALASMLFTATASTQYEVLVETDSGIRRFRAGRFRQIAVSEIGVLEDDAVLEPLSSNLLISDWSVDGQRYSVARRHQRAMTRLAGSQ